MFVYIIILVAIISWTLASKAHKAFDKETEKEQAIISYTVSTYKGVTVLKVDNTSNGFFWQKEVVPLERGVPKWVVWAFSVACFPLILVTPILPHVFVKAVCDSNLSKRRQWAAVSKAASGHFGEDYYIVVGPDATEDVIHHEWIHYTQVGDSQTRFERELEAYSKAQGYTGLKLHFYALMSCMSH